MKVSDKLVLHFLSPSDATIFLRSFLPEDTTLPNKRSQWKITTEETSADISFDIEADDLTAFRATINSIIQMAYIVDTTLKTVEEN